MSSKKLINWLKARYKQEMFYPGILGLLINPFFFSRRALANGVRNLGHHIKGKTLDVGCGHKPYRDIFATTDYVGLEIADKEGRSKFDAEHLYQGEQFPFEDETFDSVFTSQVLEHVFHPEQHLREICRVLRSSGVLLLTVPFVWDEHEQPIDFGRYSSFGLTAMLERNGFEVIELHKTLDDFRTPIQLIIAYLYKISSANSKLLRVVVQLLVIAPINFFGLIMAWLLPKNPDLYLDNVVLARKRTN